MQQVAILDGTTGDSNENFDIAALREYGKLVLGDGGGSADVRAIVALCAGEGGAGDDRGGTADRTRFRRLRLGNHLAREFHDIDAVIVKMEGDRSGKAVEGVAVWSKDKWGYKKKETEELAIVI